MTRDEVRNDYFEWLSDLVLDRSYSDYISYEKLLMYLHSVEFRWTIPKDQNRAADGEALRYRFSVEHRHGYPVDVILGYLDAPCSVLEMMVALALRCEETIMDDPNVGNRTSQWFWGIVTSLGLGSMTDTRFDKLFVADTIERFLDRKYEPNGKGGLFTMRHTNCDLRKVEIWSQLCWYLDEIA